MSDEAGGFDSGGDSGGGVADSGTSTGGATDEARQTGPAPSGRVAGEAVDDANDTPEQKAAKAKPPAPKYKVRRGDKEEEFEGAELARRLSDEYEHEFKGPGGKPLKMRWDDIGRAVQLSEGAQARIARAAEQEKRWQEAIDNGKKDPFAFMEQYFEVPDADELALQRAAKAYQRRQELTDLMTPDSDEKWEAARQEGRQALRYNPDVYHQRIRDDLKAKNDRVTNAEKARLEKAQRAEQERRSVQEGQAKLREAFKAAGVPWSAEHEEIAKKIHGDFMQAGTRLPFSEIAELTKRQYQKNMRAQLSALAPAALYDLMGEELVKRQREHDVERLKGVKKEQRTTQAASSQQTNGKPKGLTEWEIKKQEREGRL